MSKLTQLLKRHRLDPAVGKLKLRKRHKARRRDSGDINRRVIVIGTFDRRGPNSQHTKQLPTHELQYHYTKGFRERHA